jgi:hypothetical protein
LLTVHHFWVSPLSWPGPGKSLDDSELLFVLQKFRLTLAGLPLGRQKEGVERAAATTKDGG